MYGRVSSLRARAPHSILPAIFAAIFAMAVSSRAADEINLLAFGDWGCGSSNQIRTAAELAKYVKESPKKFDATLLLGDNFYTTIVDENSPLIPLWFEKMYDTDVLKMPFYALLGNHDYQNTNVSARTELAYAKSHPESRWKMPAKYFRVDFPEQKPLVSVVMLDGNLQGKEWDEEAKWMNAELEKPRPTWLIVASHFPLFSNSEHGDSKTMPKKIGAALENHRVDFYLAGHDHNLQHIQTATNFASHIVSGAGGKELYPMFRDDRGPFTASTNGFVHLSLTPSLATVRFVSESGKTMHLFERTPDGKVKVLETTGVQKAVPRPSPEEAKKKKKIEG